MSAGKPIQQYDIPERQGCEAVFDSSYLLDIPHYLDQWQSKRVVLVVSKSLESNTNYIKDLEAKLGDKVVGKQSGVGSHSPYKDVISIAHLLQSKDADCLICIGSSSYSDASKIATKLHATLPPNFTAEDMESLINQKRGAGILKPAKVKLILLPTSLSAAEWNGTGSCTNSSGKKQHFGLGNHLNGAADVLLWDPELASTAPEKLWLSSGVRCIDHCVETMTHESCTPEASRDAEAGLADMIRGLGEYREGKGKDRKEVLRGISESQKGSRQAIKGLIVHRSPFGPSHAIGHQLGSVAGVMHGVTSCVMLGPVLRFSKPKTQQAQEKILKIFNETLGWRETEAADAFIKFVQALGLPTTLHDVGVTDDETIRKIAEKTMTDVWGGQGCQLSVEEVMEILDMAR